MDVGLAVGNDNKPIVANLPLHQPLQILFSPHTDLPQIPSRRKSRPAAKAGKSPVPIVPQKTGESNRRAAANATRRQNLL